MTAIKFFIKTIQKLLDRIHLVISAVTYPFTIIVIILIYKYSRGYIVTALGVIGIILTGLLVSAFVQTYSDQVIDFIQGLHETGEARCRNRLSTKTSNNEDQVYYVDNKGISWSSKENKLVGLNIGGLSEDETRICYNDTLNGDFSLEIKIEDIIILDNNNSPEYLEVAVEFVSESSFNPHKVKPDYKFGIVWEGGYIEDRPKIKYKFWKDGEVILTGDIVTDDDLLPPTTLKFDKKNRLLRVYARNEESESWAQVAKIYQFRRDRYVPIYYSRFKAKNNARFYTVIEPFEITPIQEIKGQGYPVYRYKESTTGKYYYTDSEYYKAYHDYFNKPENLEYEGIAFYALNKDYQDYCIEGDAFPTSTTGESYLGFFSRISTRGISQVYEQIDLDPGYICLLPYSDGYKNSVPEIYTLYNMSTENEFYTSNYGDYLHIYGKEGWERSYYRRYSFEFY